MNNHDAIIKNYFKNIFFLDFIALSIFLFGLFEDSSTPVSYRFIKILFYVKKKTLDEIYHKLMNNFKLLMIIHTSLIDLINLLLFSFFVIHVCACIWYLQSTVQFGEDIYQLTWLTKMSLEREENYIIYLYSLYWSTVTVMTVGYGDIIPQNKYETLFCTFAIFLGCMVFAYILNSIGMIISDLNKEKSIFK